MADQASPERVEISGLIRTGEYRAKTLHACVARNTEGYLFLMYEKAVLRHTLVRCVRSGPLTRGDVERVPETVLALLKAETPSRAYLERHFRALAMPEVDTEFVLHGMDVMEAVASETDARRLAIVLATDCVATRRAIAAELDGVGLQRPVADLTIATRQWTSPMRAGIAKSFWELSRDEELRVPAELEAAKPRIGAYVAAIKAVDIDGDRFTVKGVLEDAPPPPAPTVAPAKGVRRSKAAPVPTARRKPAAAREEVRSQEEVDFWAGSSVRQIAACLNDYLPQWRGQVSALERVALRERSWRVREMLAAVASSGALDYRGLLDLVASANRGNLGPQAFGAFGLQDYRGRAAAALARVAANQQLHPDDDADALTLYSALQRHVPGILRPIDFVQHVLLLLAHGTAAEAASILESSNLQEHLPLERTLLLSSVLIKAAHESGRSASTDCLFPLNLAYRDLGYESVRIGRAANPYEGLTSEPVDRLIADGPLISVLMTTYNPSEKVDFAIRSVLNQTWRNLELIIVDDASPDYLFGRLKTWEQRDNRVRVFRQPVNGGTYAAKNLGLTHASGEFVTCHDSDDWSHPRKLEHQARGIMRANAVASISHWVRTLPTMEFQMFSGGGTLSYENPSSLMYRRAPARERVGFYDAVRTGADSEFKSRLELALNATTLITGEVPLAFGLVHAEALTAGTLGRGWFSHSRRVYRGAWHLWHQQIRRGHGSPLLEREPAARHFAVPPELLPAKPASTPSAQYDVVMISDFRMGGGNTVSAIEEMKAQSRAGLRTAICQVGAFRKGFMHKEYVDEKVQEVVSAGMVDWIDLDTAAKARLLTIRYPGVFHFAERMSSRIKADNIQVIVNQPPCEADSSDRRYDVATCAANIERIFEGPQTWSPIGPNVRDSIVPFVKGELLAEADWYNIIDIDEWGGARERPHWPKPVLGRHGRDDYSKWPDTRQKILDAYPADPAMEVRVLGGAASISSLMQGPLPANWKVREFNEIAPRDFVKEFDFFVFFHHPHRVEAFGRTVIEAMAGGCVALLPKSFEPLFKESAIYCTEADVRGIVSRLHANPAEFAERSRAGVDYVRANFSYSAHTRRLQRLIGR